MASECGAVGNANVDKWVEISIGVEGGDMWCIRVHCSKDCAVQYSVCTVKYSVCSVQDSLHCSVQ